MTAALAVTALASCSDELIERNKQLNVKPGDLVATLPSANAGANTRVAVISGGQFVWSDDDQIQVYKLDNLNYSKYELTSGGGEETGVFTKKSGETLSGDDLYAVTQPQPKKGETPTIYGISASESGQAILTATIADSYDWATLDSNGKTAYKVPTPFWGNAQISGDNINVDFNALTGFLKLDLRALPAGTDAIVLTTHEDFDLAVDPSDPTKNISYTGGKNESLSGTLKAELTAGAALQADDRLHHADTLRVNIDEIINEDGEDYILYIPVVAQHYEKLYVLAVKEDNRLSYTYNDFEILRTFEDFDFEISNVIPALKLSEVIDVNALGATNWADASNIIADNIDGSRTLRVKIKPSSLGAGQLWIAGNMEKNNVEIEFTDAPAAGFEGIFENNATLNGIGEFKSFGVSPMTLDKAKNLQDAQMAKKRTVRLKFDGALASNTSIVLPTSNVEIDSEVDQTKIIKVFASNTTGVSGYDQDVYNKKDAAITIRGGVKADGTPVDYTEIQVATNSRGDVFITEEDTYVQQLTFEGTSQLGNVRITDALVNNIQYSGVTGTAQVSVFTTGSAALGGIAGDANLTKVYAYWTGKSLTDNALMLGFDKATIYTAAQLQGVGLAAGLQEGGGSFTFSNGSNLTALTPVYNYTIADRVSSIWLGGYKYPWLGAQVAQLVGTPVADGYGTNRAIKAKAKVTAPSDPITDYFVAVTPQQLTKAVKIDGNKKQLRNMKLSIDDPYIVDPHKCCTTCGELAVKVDEDLGLVRCIMTTATATVTNINLNDVLLESTTNINNVGAIVGEIGATGAVELSESNVTNERIETLGNNIGGQVGNIFTKATVDILGVLVGQQVAETGTTDLFVKSTGSNVGGVVGNVDATGAITAEAAVVHIDEISATKGSNVGGLLGDAYSEDDSEVTSSEVIVPVILATQATNNDKNLIATGNNVGGLIGQYINKKNDLSINDIKVVAKTKIAAENQNAAGLIGYAMPDVQSGTTAGSILIADDATAALVPVNVEAGTIQADNGYVGGLLGYVVTGEGIEIATVSKTVAAKDELNPITVKINNKLAGAFGVGGLIGLHNTPATIGLDGKANLNYLTVTVKDFENTWALADFQSEAKAKYLTLSVTERKKNLGSFGLLDGLQNANLTIEEAAKIVTGGDCTVENAAGVMSEKKTETGRQVITNAKKIALLFPYHVDSYSTLPSNAGDQFWGDVNGYVGYSKEGAVYEIDGVEQQGDQLCNVFITYAE